MEIIQRNHIQTLRARDILQILIKSISSPFEPSNLQQQQVISYAELNANPKTKTIFIPFKRKPPSFLLSKKQNTKPEMSQSGDEYDEEEFLVYADLQSKIASEVLIDPDVNIQVLGFEDQNPVMQINNKLFQGTFEYTLGTHVFFNVDPDPPQRLENYEHSPDVTYKLFASTDKIIAMDRMFIDPKADPDNNDREHDEPTPIPITKSYSMALNQFLKSGDEPPRNLDDECETFYKKYGPNSSLQKTENTSIDPESQVE